MKVFNIFGGYSWSGGYRRDINNPGMRIRKSLVAKTATRAAGARTFGFALAS